MFWKSFYLPVTVLVAVMLVACLTGYNFISSNFSLCTSFLILPLIVLIFLIEFLVFHKRMMKELERRFQERDKRLRSFWSYCRHGLLNHLQMISLMAQLKYNNRMVSYINKVHLELDEWNKLLQIKHPDIALYLLEQRNNLELGTTFNLETDLENLGSSPEEVIRCLDLAINETEKYLKKDSGLKVDIEEWEQEYLFFLYSLEEHGDFLPRRIMDTLSSCVEKAGGRFTCKTYPGNLLVMSLAFPRQQPDEKHVDFESYLRELELDEGREVSFTGY